MLPSSLALFVVLAYLSHDVLTTNVPSCVTQYSHYVWCAWQPSDQVYNKLHVCAQDCITDIATCRLNRPSDRISENAHRLF